MKTAFGIFTTLLFFPLSVTLANPKPRPFTCAIDRPPTVTIYPGKGTAGDDEILIVFKNPDEQKWRPDHVTSFKVKDTDGQVNLILLSYLAQNPSEYTASKEFHTLLKTSLRKRLAYWKAKEASKSNTDDELILITTSVQMNEFLLKKVEKGDFLSSDEMKILIRDVLGPLTDYNEIIRYEYSEFKDGKFVPQTPKKLSEFLPKEFYQTATSTKTGGTLDIGSIGKDHCAPVPSLGAKETIKKETDAATTEVKTPQNGLGKR